MLRPAPAGTNDPLETACFPLVPYANRIADGRFAFAGETHQLPPNFGDHPHSLHGLGWQSAWRVRASDDRATLALEHDGDDRWPWAFSAEQRFRLDAGGLLATILLANTGRRAMPAGIGFHPYFQRAGDTRLTMSTGAMWLGDATMLPVGAVPPDHFGDWAIGAGLPETLIDNSFEDWAGSAAICTGDTTTRITATGARGVHLYAPPGAGFLCIEPVTHLPDAFNRGSAYDTLEPRETLALTMRIEA